MEARNLEYLPCVGDLAIVIGGDSISSVDMFKCQLSKAGIAEVKVLYELPEILCRFLNLAPEIILIYKYRDLVMDESMRRVRLWREWGYKGWIVVVTEDPSLELLMRCLQSGVDDILAYGQYLSLDEEIRNLLSGHRASGGVNWNPEAIMKMGLFRTLGLSEYQIRILAEYALDFPRHRILAERIGTNGNQLRKIFSRIYEKLDEKFAVSNQAQLAQFLTICSTLG